MQRMLPVLLILWALVQATGLPACAACTSSGPLQPDQGCSVVYATDGEWMLGGNNEDYFNPLTRVWFIPAGAGSFGRVYLGFDDYHAQGSMNDQGLFFDGLALDGAYPVSKEGKQQVAGNLVDRAMARCATVDCVVGLFQQYYAHDSWRWQFFFGDATGESAIVEADAILRQRGGYQVATNFPQSITPPEERTCPRYRTAVERLESMEALSVEAMRDLMDALHQDGPVHTLYSNVYDLKNRLVYLYYFHSYEDGIVLDLGQELALGYHAYDLPSLFPPNQEAEDWAGPRLRSYHKLIESRLATGLDPELLQAYAGAYEMPEGWGPPDATMAVIAGDRSLHLRFPDYRQHELFPESPADFFHVAFHGSDFSVAYEARFVLDDDRRVEALELFFGLESIRLDRLGPESTVPEPVPTTITTSTRKPTHTAHPTALLAPTAATARPAATPMPVPQASQAARALSAPTAQVAAWPATSVEEAAISTGPDEGAGLPWTWLIVLLVAVGASAAWAAIRRGRLSC